MRSDEALGARLLDLTEELVRVPSASGDERPLADAVEERLRALPGATVHRARHTLVLERDGDPPHVLLAGHLDTVPPADPPQPACRDGCAVAGRGAVDMKGGVAVAIALAEDAERRPPLRTTVVLYDREETGSHGSGMALVADRLAADRPDTAVLLEPTGGWVEAGCQGNLRVRGTFLGRPAHTARPWTGVNAIARSLRALERCAAHDPGTVTVDGLAYRQSLVVVGVQGGGDRNVVPDRCTVVVNLRWAPGRARDDALGEVRDLLDGADEVEVTLDSPAAAPNLSAPLLQRLVARPGVRLRPKLGWTDVGRLAALGIPAANFGPGDPELAHGPDERVTGDELAFVYRALEAALCGERAA